MWVAQSLTISASNILLILLLLISTYSCLLAMPVMNQSNNGTLVIIIIIMIVFSLKFFFSPSNLYLFINFELRLVPIFIIILGWGYQSERLLAGKALFIYTAVGSVPLLMLIVYHLSFGVSGLINNTSIYSNYHLEIFCLPILAFIVKLPLIGVHIWLPKAHVEAPVVGSIFLAAILLKLGGWGLILYQHVIDSLVVADFCLALSLLGVIWISLICCQTLDRKTLIAFSSIVHMAFVVVGLRLGTQLSVRCALAVLISHGFRSSLAFFIVFIFYKSQNRRSLVLTKTINSSTGVLSLIWLGTIIAVAGCPPSFNLWVEMMCYMVFLAMRNIIVKPIFFCALRAGVYGFVLIGKIYSGSDSVFKSSVQPTQFELRQGILTVRLTVLASIRIIMLFLL